MENKPLPKKVLFICTHNSDRSHMAEGFMNALYTDRYTAFSAGTEPSNVSPYAVRIIQEIGIDISDHRSKSVRSYFRNLLRQKLDELAKKTGGARMNRDIKGMKFLDLVDWATAEQEREIGLRIIERDTALRGEVMLALEKIKDGTYGFCDSCGQEIESGCLDAMPVTSLCIECKRREEARLKRTGS